MSKPLSHQSQSTTSFAFSEDEALYGVNAADLLSADKAAAKEMNQLSAEERDELYEEIHGVQGKLAAESPDFLQDIFIKLDRSLSLISPADRKVYDQAVFLKPSLVDDRSFHLMFLRACKYKTAQTATRICTYFRNKLSLFGEELLVHKITLDDLSSDDLDSLEKSRATFLPCTDQSGRFVFIDDGHNMQYKDPLNMVRQIWYQCMVFCERDDVQLNGVVGVTLALGECRVGWKARFQLAKLFGMISDSVPLRIASFHFLADNDQATALAGSLKTVTGKQLRLRFRVHFGTRSEVQTVLSSFGIPGNGWLDDSPLPYWETIQGIIHQQRLNETHIDGSLPTDNTVSRLAPKRDDVLCGRGRPFHSFPGNKRFYAAVQKNLPRYLSSKNRGQKSAILMELVKNTQKYGACFLKRVPRGWEQVEDKVARSKVSEVMRQARLKSAKRKETSTVAHTSNMGAFHELIHSRQPSPFDDWSIGTIESISSDEEIRETKRIRLK